MNTKKSAKSEVVVKPAPAAAKPLSKSSPVKVTKPPVAKLTRPAVVKVTKPAVVKPAKSAVVKPAPVQASKEAAKEAKVKAVKEPKAAKKPKVVRDSFTMPQSEYLKIAQIKEIGLKAGLQVKKSEVLRAGVIALCAMDEAQLKRALSGLDKIKTGRPNKH
jgi:hypothetical protein